MTNFLWRPMHCSIIQTLHHLWKQITWDFTRCPNRCWKRCASKRHSRESESVHCVLWTHLAYLHPRQVTLNWRMSHGDAAARSAPPLGFTSCLQSPCSVSKSSRTPRCSHRPSENRLGWKERNVLPHTLTVSERAPSHPKNKKKQLSQLTNVWAKC